jgi:VanZ family protein
VAAGWALVAAIIWLSLAPKAPTLDMTVGDKIGHLAAYGVLMLWFCVLYRRKRVRAFYALGFVALGVVLEFMQGNLGYRTFDLLDMAANTAGVMAGWGLASSVRILR